MKVILFGNEKCGSCKKWKPTFEKLMRQYNINYGYVDIDNEIEMKNKHNIHAIPDTLFFDDDGKEMGHILGNMVEDIAIKQIEYYLNGGKGETQG